MSKPLNKYYRNLEFDNLDIIQEKVLKLLPENKFGIWNVLMAQFLTIPELYSNLIKNNLCQYVNAIQFSVYPMCVHGEYQLSIHTDDTNHTYSLNLPIANCNNTYVYFYKSDHKPNIKMNPHKHGFYYYLSSDLCEKTDSLEMTTPCIINTQVLHNIFNPNSLTRIALLLRLNNKFTEEDFNKF